MKNKKRVIILATCIAFFVLMVSVVIGFVNKDAHSIVGGWEADTQMINSSSSDKSNSGKIQFFTL